jgi:hypothetical protein
MGSIVEKVCEDVRSRAMLEVGDEADVPAASAQLAATDLRNKSMHLMRVERVERRKALDQARASSPPSRIR